MKPSVGARPTARCTPLLHCLPVARQAGRLSELEMACRESACRRFSDQQAARQAVPQRLAGILDGNGAPTGTHPATAARLRHSAEPSGDRTHRANPTDDFDLLQTALHHYRDMGFSIALDDLGAGYSKLALCGRSYVRDYVKIDRHFIDGIHQDALKREFVGSILQIAKASRAQVIAEGI